jgi:hypothetical protein
LKGNRQIGLDGRIFINDCLSDGIFFVYSIILSGLLGATGDILKLTGRSGYVMDPLTNGLILLDLACCLGLVVVSYYVYFMNCGENMPKLGVRPLIYLEYLRLAYYGLLIYDVLYRFCDEIVHSGEYPIAMSVFYCVYLGWLIACAFAAMFILTVLNQNMIRRSYSDSFRILALAGMTINIIMPFVFFITKIWIKGPGDGFYSSAFCDLLRLGIAPVFYAAIWFLFLNAIDQVDRVFNEVDNAIRDKNYRIEFEEEEDRKSARKAARLAKKADKKAGEKKNGKRSKKKAKDASDTPEGGEVSVEVDPEIAFETPDSHENTEDGGDPAADGIIQTDESAEADDIGGRVDLQSLFDEEEENNGPTDGNGEAPSAEAQPQDAPSPENTDHPEAADQEQSASE